MEDAEHHYRAFVQTWAEAVARQVKHVREMRDKAARDGRVYERMDPELDLMSLTWHATRASCGPTSRR